MSHVANLRASQRASVALHNQSITSSSSALPINGVNGILKGSTTHNLTAAPPENIKALKQKRQDDSAATIAHADVEDDTKQDEVAVLEISSEDSEEDDDSEGDGNDHADGQRQHFRHLNGSLAQDDSSTRIEENAGGTLDSADRRQPKAGKSHQSGEMHEGQEHENLSFGDLLQARGETTVDIGARDENESVSAAAANRLQKSTLTIPNASSLGNVLTQALRTNDAPLLESCLHVGNLQSIRSTIERLPSQQAGLLLQKLAERMHKRPGRAGSLMVWIQWTIVAHGGYLATQPHVMNELKELYRVVKMRADALQPLLALKGKLDMLEAQLQLRRNRMAADPQTESDEDGGLIYVEPELAEEEEETSEGNGTGAAKSAKPLTKQTSKASIHRDLTFDTEEEDDDKSMINGADQYVDDDGSEDDDEDQDLIDDEAESTDNEEEGLSDEDIDFDEVDGQEESSADEEPVAKRKKHSR